MGWPESGDYSAFVEQRQVEIYILTRCPAMAIVERHLSADGLLQLIVDLADDGDWSIGFDGFAWHTHGDMLMFEYGGSPESATRAFLDDILTSRRVIVISRLDGKICNVWVTNDPSQDEMKYASPNETIEKREWNGVRVEE